MRFFAFAFFVLMAPLWAQTAPITTHIAPGGVASGAQVSQSGGVWRVENRAPGSFSTRFELPKPAESQRIARFAFDWKPSPGVKLNLFFKVAGRFYGAILTGPEEFRPGTISFGKAVQKPQRDGFLRVEIPLRALLISHNPSANALPLEEILLGNWSNENYLMAGMGGNRVGDFYDIKNILFTPFEGAKPLQIGEPHFQNHDLLVPLNPKGELEAQGLKLRVFEKTYELGSPFLRLETAPDGAQSLRFLAGLEGIKLENGAALPFVVESSTGSARGEAKWDFSLVASPPKPTVTRPAGAPFRGDFEHDLFQFSPVSSVAERVFDGARNGQVLRLSNPKIASRFDTLVRSSLDVRAFPALHFWYRADDRVRLDFRFSWKGGNYLIRFLDRDPENRRANAGNAVPIVRVGAIEGAQGDGSWREATFDLLGALRKINDKATDFQIQNLTLGDEGWMGNARGVQIFLDDFSFVPRVQNGDSWRVVFPDLSGLEQISFAINGASQPGNLGPSTPRTEIALQAPGEASGLHFLHLRARNRAGKWSETATFPLWFAGTSP